MEWRPDDGWEEIKREILDRHDIDYMSSDEGTFIEEGADAMLKVLKAKFHHLICLGIREDGKG